MKCSWLQIAAAIVLAGAHEACVGAGQSEGPPRADGGSLETGTPDGGELQGPGVPATKRCKMSSAGVVAPFSDGDSCGAFRELFARARARGCDVVVAPGVYRMGCSFAPGTDGEGFHGVVEFQDVTLVAGSANEGDYNAVRAWDGSATLDGQRASEEEPWPSNGRVLRVNSRSAVPKYVFFDAAGTADATFAGRLELRGTGGPDPVRGNLVALGVSGRVGGSRAGAARTVWEHVRVEGFQIGIFGTPELQGGAADTAGFAGAVFKALYMEDVAHGFVLGRGSADDAFLKGGHVLQRYGSYLHRTSVHFGAMFHNNKYPGAFASPSEVDEAQWEVGAGASLQIGALYQRSNNQSQRNPAECPMCTWQTMAYGFAVGGGAKLRVGHLHPDINGTGYARGAAVALVGAGWAAAPSLERSEVELTCNWTCLSRAEVYFGAGKAVAVVTADHPSGAEATVNMFVTQAADALGVEVLARDPGAGASERSAFRARSAGSSHDLPFSSLPLRHY